MKRSWKIVISIVLLLLAAIGAGIWYLSREWKPILNDRLQAFVHSSSNGLYTLSYDEFDFSLYTGHAYLRNVELTPNQAVYEQLKASKQAPDNVYTLRIRSIQLKNFHPRRLYRQQKLNINSILIEDPTVLVAHENLPENDTVSVQPKTPYQQISQFLKELRIDDLQVTNLNYTHQNNNAQDKKETALKNINIHVQNFLIDSLAQADSSRVYYSKGIDLAMDSYQLATRDSMYYVEIKDINFSTSKRQLRLGNVSMKPRHSKEEFYKVAPKPSERFDMSFDSLLIRDIDLPALLNDQRFHASNFSIQRSNIEIYNNTNYARPKSSKKGKDPHQQLKQLAWNFRIDTISIASTTFEYIELNKTSQKLGKLTFAQSAIRFLNVTNDSLSLQSNPILEASVRTRFMNAAPLEVKFEFDLLADAGDFKFQGQLSGMNGRALNPLLNPLAQVEIQSANIQRLAFNFTANQNRSRGIVNFRYQDLKIQLVGEKEESFISKNKIASSLANNFLINTSNPLPSGKFIHGNVSYPRPESESFFKFVWKSIFQGIKTSAGVSQERETRLKNTALDTKRAVNKVGSFIKGVFKKNTESD